jgi:hypothetical protein
MLPIFAPFKVRNMFIQCQETPNPMTLKFLPGRRILAEPGRTYEVFFSKVYHFFFIFYA